MTVAILGRPNVGKSTLFNRLCRVRQAITHAEPGVTRDLGYGAWDIDGAKDSGGAGVTLIDSGGVITGRNDEPLADQVSGRARGAAAGADVILLVVDLDGPTATDHALADDLRRSGTEPIVVVNKADHAGRDADAARFHELGFGGVVAVSAAHGRGIDALTELARTRLAAAAATAAAGAGAAAPGDSGPPEPAGTAPAVRLALLGRPNTGKSTLLNALTGRPLAVVDSVPGTTRDPVAGRFAARAVRFEAVDTAGLRRRERVNEPVEYYATQRSVDALERSDVTVLLADASQEIADQDKRLASLAVRKGNGLVVALNKWDLCRPDERERVIARARRHLPALSYVPLVTLSARERTGVTALIDACAEVAQQRSRTVSTSQINQAVRRWNRTPGAGGAADAAAPGRRPLRVQYGVQTGANPVRLLFFVNRAPAPANYRRYLENRARADLGFDRVPIIVEVRGPSPRRRAGAR